MSFTIDTLLEKADISLALLKVLAENSFDSILVTDASLEGKVIYANQAFETLTGHDPVEVFGYGATLSASTMSLDSLQGRNIAAPPRGLPDKASQR